MTTTRQTTQKAAILAHLKEHGKISQLQALRMFGCMRLADVIYKLRLKGYDIATTWRKQGDSRYAVYRLQEPQDER